MLKKGFASNLLASLIWLLVITFLRWNWKLELIGLWIGGLLGIFFLDIDHLLYTLMIYPQKPTSLKVRQLIEQRRFKETLSFLVDTNDERVKLSFHNAIFQVVFSVFCFWVLSSTAGLFGKGLVMAMALHLLKDEFHLLLAGREELLRRWLFWPIRREVSFREQRIFVILMLLIFLGLNLLLG